MDECSFACDSQFLPSARPVDLDIHLHSFTIPLPFIDDCNVEARIRCYQHSPTKPVIVFVPSRKQCRLTVDDLLAHCAADEKPDRFHEALSKISASCSDCLVASKDTAWSLPVASYMVIVMGVQYYEGKGDFAPGPKGPWMIYCFLLTCFVPPFLLRSCGIKTPEQQRAWREKMGLLSIILVLMAGVGFLTFGFTETVCGKPANRFHGGAIGDEFIGKGSVTINGFDYNFANFRHPAVGPFNSSQNPVLDPSWNLAGNDASFLFPNVNHNRLGLITKASNST